MAEANERAVATRDVIPAAPGELTVQHVVAQVVKIQELMKLAMKKDEHFGIIPGTNKPSLLKPGAEKLCLMFRLDPQYSVHEIREGEHLTVTSTCVLYHVTSGVRMGSGMGSCSTRESKYAYRKAERVCPECGKAAIIKGQEQYGGGWVCWKKKEGCGAKFNDGDEAIEKQESGRVPNPDLADQYNTILKMSNKRSLVAAVLNVTAASDIFTQDMEDLQERMEPVEQERVDRSSNQERKEKTAGDGDAGSAGAGDADGSPPSSTYVSKPGGCTPKALAELERLIEATKTQTEILFKSFKIKALHELKPAQYENMFNILQARKNLNLGGTQGGTQA